MGWLCDTNIVSEIMRREPNPGVIRWVAARDELVLSVITLEEIRYGLARRELPRKAAWFGMLIKSRCRIEPIDQAIAEKAGRWRGLFARDGVSRTQADLLIVATVWKGDHTLVTRNTRDFEGCGIPLLNPFT
mgnify:FL=1